MKPEIRASFASMFPAPREKALEALEVPVARSSHWTQVEDSFNHLLAEFFAGRI